MLLIRERFFAILCMIFFAGIGALVGEYFGRANDGAFIGSMIGIIVAIYLMYFPLPHQTKKLEKPTPDSRHISRRKRKRKSHK